MGAGAAIGHPARAAKVPALAFCCDVGRYSEAGRETVEYFLGLEDLSTCTSWELKHGQRLDMVLVGPDLQCWRVVGVLDQGVVRPLWERLFRMLVRQSVHRIDQ